MRQIVVEKAAQSWMEWVHRVLSLNLNGTLPPTVVNTASYRLFANFQSLTLNLADNVGLAPFDETIASRAFQSSVRGNHDGVPAASLFAHEVWKFLAIDFPNPKSPSTIGKSDFRYICLGICALRKIQAQGLNYDSVSFGLDFLLFLFGLSTSGFPIQALVLAGFFPDLNIRNFAPPDDFKDLHQQFLDRLHGVSPKNIAEKSLLWILAAEAFFQLTTSHPAHFLPQLFNVEIERIVTNFRHSKPQTPPDFVAIATALQALYQFSATGLTIERIQFLCELGEKLSDIDPLTATKILGLVTPVTSRFRMRAKEVRERLLEQMGGSKPDRDPKKDPAPPNSENTYSNQSKGSSPWAQLSTSAGPTEFAKNLSSILQSSEWLTLPRFFIQIQKNGHWENFDRRSLMYGMGQVHQIHEEIRVGFDDKENSTVINTFLNAARSAATAALGFPVNRTKPDGTNLYYGISEPGLADFHDILTDIQDMSLEANILICGEPGVGKTQLARHIHRLTMGAKAQFATFSFADGHKEEMTAAMLFGQVKGSFTDAQDRPGFFETLSGKNPGTVFLDEIGEAPINIQAQILRVTSERRVTRIGSLKELEVNCRLIAATNRDIQELLKTGAFRFDLYSRFDVIIQIPPLRATPGQIIPVANQYLNGPDLVLSEDAKRLLTGLPWHTNYRGLEKLIKNAADKARKQKLGIIDAALLNRIAQRMPEISVLSPGPLTSIHPLASGSTINEENPFARAVPLEIQAPVLFEEKPNNVLVHLNNSNPNLSPTPSKMGSHSDPDVFRQFQRTTEFLYKKINPQALSLVFEKSRRVAINHLLRNGILWGQKQQSSILEDLKRCLPNHEQHSPELTSELIEEFDAAYQKLFSMKKGEVQTKVEVAENSKVAKKPFPHNVSLGTFPNSPQKTLLDELSGLTPNEISTRYNKSLQVFREIVSYLYGGIPLRTRNLFLGKSQRVSINDFLRSSILWGEKQQKVIVENLKECLKNPDLDAPNLELSKIEEFDQAFLHLRVLTKAIDILPPLK